MQQRLLPTALGLLVIVSSRPASALPVIINGVDVTGAVVEGDWGLYSPHMVGPTVVIPDPWRSYGGDPYWGGYVQGGYYPAFGREPGYGRHEIEPPPDRRLPPPAQRYHRSWSSHSDPVPASFDPPVHLNVSPEIYPNAHHAMPRIDGRETRLQQLSTAPNRPPQRRPSPGE